MCMCDIVIRYGYRRHDREFRSLCNFMETRIWYLDYNICSYESTSFNVLYLKFCSTSEVTNH